MGLQAAVGQAGGEGDVAGHLRAWGLGGVLERDHGAGEETKRQLGRGWDRVCRGELGEDRKGEGASGETGTQLSDWGARDGEEMGEGKERGWCQGRRNRNE